jgi:3-hydroxybutyryl-CoA dehydrogenase
MTDIKRICIFGERELVEDYAILCFGKGLHVEARVNDAGESTSRRAAAFPLPKGVRKVAKPSRATQLAIELTNTSRDTKRENLVELDKSLSPKALILSSSVGVTVEEQSRWVKHPQRLVGIGALPTLLANGLVEIAMGAGTSPDARHSAEGFFQQLGKEVAAVQDAVGMVMPRILCMLINEACFALSEGVSTQKDIDTAMKLGTNYPRGPVEWAEKIGFAQVYAVISSLHHYFGEERYRPAPTLHKAALLGRIPV